MAKNILNEPMGDVAKVLHLSMLEMLEYLPGGFSRDAGAKDFGKPLALYSWADDRCRKLALGLTAMLSDWIRQTQPPEQFKSCLQDAFAALESWAFIKFGLIAETYTEYVKLFMDAHIQSFETEIGEVVPLDPAAFFLGMMEGAIYEGNDGWTQEELDNLATGNLFLIPDLETGEFSEASNEALFDLVTETFNVRFLGVWNESDCAGQYA